MTKRLPLLHSWRTTSEPKALASESMLLRRPPEYQDNDDATYDCPPHGLVVEQPRTLLDKGDAQILCSFEDRLIIVAADWTGDIFHATPCCSIHIVDERKLESGQHCASRHHALSARQTYESVTAHSDTSQLV